MGERAWVLGVGDGSVQPIAELETDQIEALEEAGRKTSWPRVVEK
jgi:hypothetical protein